MSETTYKFFDKVKQIGRSTKYLTIPYKIARVEELKEGDLIEITIKRAPEQVLKEAMAEVARQEQALEMLRGAA